jgi:transposase
VRINLRHQILSQVRDDVKCALLRVMKYSTQELRRRAIQAYRDSHSVPEIADIFGIHRSTVYRWIERSLLDETVARKSGSGRPSALSDVEAARLLKIVLRPATRYGFETDFWTSARLIQVAKDRLQIEISRSTMCKMLRDSDFSYKKPERRYYQASEDTRQEWLSKTVPQIRKTVRKYKAILYFEDEATIRLTGVLARTWGPRGERIIQKVTGLRGSVPAMSALGPSGHLIFQLYDKRIASGEVISFLSEMLRHHPRRHLVVVMDRAKPHTSKMTKTFIKKNRRLHVFYLPPYSPDMNPDEQIWNYLKNEELKSHRALNTEQLRILAQKKLQKMSQSKSVLKAIFFRSCVADFFA